MGLEVSKKEAIDIDENEDLKNASKILSTKKFIVPKKEKK